MFGKQNKKLLFHYLSEFRDFLQSMFSVINEMREYYSKTCNHGSATDSHYLESLENLCDKISYFEKYLGVSLEFYDNV